MYNNFLDYHCNWEDARFVIIPVPMELTVCHGKGAGDGPRAILEASVQLETYDVEFKGEPIKSGICTLIEPLMPNSSKPEDYIEAVRREVGRCIRDSKIPIVLGGEHSVSYGMFKGILDNKKGFSILHFDAHLDLRDTYNGSKYSHACTVRRMRDHGDEFNNIISLGVRAVSPEEADYLRSSDHKVYFASELCRRDLDEINSLLGKELYITFDVDALDPSILPSTGAPEPGGLAWNQTLEILKAALSGRKLLGFDIVELAPDGINHYSEYTAAKLLYKIITYNLLYGVSL